MSCAVYVQEKLAIVYIKSRCLVEVWGMTGFFLEESDPMTTIPAHSSVRACKEGFNLLDSDSLGRPLSVNRTAVPRAWPW